MYWDVVRLSSKVCSKKVVLPLAMHVWSCFLCHPERNCPYNKWWYHEALLSCSKVRLASAKHTNQVCSQWLLSHIIGSKASRPFTTVSCCQRQLLLHTKPKFFRVTFKAFTIVRPVPLPQALVSWFWSSLFPGNNFLVVNADNLNKFLDDNHKAVLVTTVLTTCWQPFFLCVVVSILKGTHRASHMLLAMVCEPPWWSPYINLNL